MHPLLPLALLLAPAPASGEVWFRIEGDNGQLVGWQHEQRIVDADGIRQSRETVMAYRIDGHPPTRSVVRVEQKRDAGGRLLAMRVGNGEGARAGVREWTVEGAAVVATDGAGRELGRFALPPGLDLRDGEALLSLDAGDAGFADIAPGELRPVAARLDLVPMAEGIGARTAAIVYHGERMRHAWFVERDADGAIAAAEQPLFGSRLVYRRSDRPLSDADLARPASLPHQLRPAPYAITPGAMRGHIRYVFAAPLGVRLALPESGEQAVREEADGALRLDICRGCGPGLSTDPADLDRWRQPSPWLQSDAPEIVRAAHRVAASKASDQRRMIELAMIARRQLATVDYEGHRSALDAWRRRAGDCTEDAVVLAALARAAGIPARVVNGLVYSRERYHGATNAFFLHSWIVAYADGEWRSFDMTTGGFDATHIALSIDDGDLASIVAANQTAALLDWRSMAEVRPRPAP